MWPHVSRPIRSSTPVPLRRHDDPKHGTLAAYKRGCSCVACRLANTHAQRLKRTGDQVWLRE